MFPGGSMDERIGQGERRSAPKGSRGQSRVRFLAFGAVALLSVAALAIGLARVFVTPPQAGPPTGNSGATARDPFAPPASRPLTEGTPSRRDPSGDVGMASLAPSETAEIPGRAEGPSVDSGDDSGEGAVRPSARATPRRVSALLDKLAERRAAIRADPHRAGRVTSRADQRGSAAGFAPSNTEGSSAASASAQTFASGPESAAPFEDALRSPYTPGYAEVAGVEVRTPAHAAGIRRGDRILEYNGMPVEGRTALENAWDQPGQGVAVPVLVEDGRTGQVREVYVPPGNFGIVQPPANRR